MYTNIHILSLPDGCAKPNTIKEGPPYPKEDII